RRTFLDDSCCDTPLHVSRTNPHYGSFVCMEWGVAKTPLTVWHTNEREKRRGARECLVLCSNTEVEATGRQQCRPGQGSPPSRLRAGINRAGHATPAQPGARWR